MSFRIGFTSNTYQRIQFASDDGPDEVFIRTMQAEGYTSVKIIKAWKEAKARR